MKNSVSKVLGLAVLGGFLACGKANLSSPEPNNGPLFSKDVTDHRICQQAIPTGTSLFVGGWRADFAGIDGTSYSKKIFISIRSISSILICQRGSQSVVAQAQANLAVNTTQLQVLNSSSDSQTLDDGKTKSDCRAEFNQNDVFQYEFEGPCLRLRKPGESVDQAQVYIPAQ